MPWEEASQPTLVDGNAESGFPFPPMGVTSDSFGPASSQGQYFSLSDMGKQSVHAHFCLAGTRRHHYLSHSRPYYLHVTLPGRPVQVMLADGPLGMQ